MTEKPELSAMSAGWDREWAYVQERAHAPREPRLGCSTVSHDRLGFCRGCVRPVHGDLNGSDLELAGWRLLALRPADEKGKSVKSDAFRVCAHCGAGHGHDEPCCAECERDQHAHCPSWPTCTRSDYDRPCEATAATKGSYGAARG